MKKFKSLPVILIVLLLPFLFLNLKVTSNQCINGECRVLVLPFYLKTLNFFSRHFNYKWLAGEIIRGAGSNEEARLKRTLEWTLNNLKRDPQGFPVVDDHAWNIIVRGYGADDQIQDVFATLSNYSGFDAFFCYLWKNRDRRIRKSFSFVKLKRGWTVLDVYSGVYFRNHKGRFSTIEEIKRGDWHPVCLREGAMVNVDYAAYLRDLNSINGQSWKYSRAAIQSPLRRVIYAVRAKLKRN